MFELRLGKLGLILFIGGMSVLLFGLFLLGVMVGKQLDTYPDQYAWGIPDLLRERFSPSPVKGEKIAKAGQDEGQDPAREGEAFDLTFFDTLAGKKREATKGEPRPATAQAVAPAALPAAGAAPSVLPGATSVPSAGETAAVPTQQPPRGGNVPPPAEGEGSREGIAMPIPAAGLPPPKEEPQRKGRFEVQAAAYREKGRAEQLVKKLAGFGFSAQVVMRDIPEKGRWYRVVVGGFEDRDNARGAAEQMAGKIKGLKCVVRIAGREE